MDGNVVVWHDERHLGGIFLKGYSFALSIVDGVDHVQCFEAVALLGCDGQVYRLAGKRLVDIGGDLSEVCTANGYAVLLFGCTHRFIDNLVNGHLDGSAVLQDKVVGASLQRYRY